MVNLYILCMVGAGTAVATQIAINAHLGAVTGSALWAANISFAVSMIAGLVALGAAILWARCRFRTRQSGPRPPGFGSAVLEEPPMCSLQFC